MSGIIFHIVDKAIEQQEIEAMIPGVSIDHLIHDIGNESLNYALGFIDRCMDIRTEAVRKALLRLEVEREAISSEDWEKLSEKLIDIALKNQQDTTSYTYMFWEEIKFYLGKEGK